MNAYAAQTSLQVSAFLLQHDKVGTRPCSSVTLSRDPKNLPVNVSVKLQKQQHSRASKIRRRTTTLEVSCSHDNLPASTLESGSCRAPLDEELILKKKSQEIKPYLNGRSIYLVGMMGSGKTTVGKVMSQVLGYSFCDCDSLIEEEVGGNSVADIFKHHGEAFFRDKEGSIYSGDFNLLTHCLFLEGTGYATVSLMEVELQPNPSPDSGNMLMLFSSTTEALHKLSLMHRLVIPTGGGAVMRPINWKYMHKGVSVWLDVPVEALAQRIAAVGTNSRPLLHYEAGDAYTQAFMRLSALFEERSEAYANANTRVSLENIASKLGQGDVSNLSPTAIAIEVFINFCPMHF
ncbi:hypothetical protein TanjilG_05795 [Lupinus angustifolius]|uniref:Shikimate kinase n=1 Tax=Lupinus angustifolius TaxID=3871 RepID=A0A4P1R3S3_LUPAN|nr:hypothetical protein TanjilG_05795 [Lupinus angustifolius]